MSLTAINTDTQRPQLYFFTELGGARALRGLLEIPGTCELIAASGAGVALALTELNDESVVIARMLAQHEIPLVAWICLPADEGFALNLANYPQTAARYRDLQRWVAEEQLRFAAVGLAIDTPGDDQEWSSWRVVRGFARGLWLARANALYPAARSAYYDLIATMRHDGYEVHAYQQPFIADDRRAGTTLMQRALDILDLPADVDVLLCASTVPIDWLDGDLGGALVASYGTVADAIAVGAVDLSAPDELPLPWPALRRDLLLAAEHTDTIYVATLEYAIRSGSLAQIADLDWGSPTRARYDRRLLVMLMRGVILGLLLVGRHGRTSIAWAGWALALLIWLRGRRRRG